MSGSTHSPSRVANDPVPVEPDYPLLLQRMTRLMEISHTLASTLDLSLLLGQIVEAGRELTGCAGVSIMLVEPRTGELRFQATTDAADGAFSGLAVPLDDSLAGWIVSHRQPLMVPRVQDDPRWNSQVDRALDFDTRSLLGVPLIARDKTIGVLEAVNKQSGAFTDDDLRTLQWLAAQAAVAIVNARLFEQSDLVSELVHELRTPLTALLATGQLLLRPDLPDGTQRELVGTLQRETERLSQLTTSFLDMVKLEAGRMPFVCAAFDPVLWVAECVAVMQPQAAQQGLTLRNSTPTALPWVESDRAKLKQVLLNLLTNALKYNRPDGSIVVCAAAVDGQLLVRVTDTGHGIPPSAVPHIFERFYRVRDRDGYVSGTGLGLPIARRIVEALGGAIDFETTVGVGTTFFFSVPLSPAPAAAGRVVPAAE